MSALVSNACKYTKPGGAVTLALRRTDRDAIVPVIDSATEPGER